MNRTRHTITLDPSVLALVDARIDGHEVRNRSQAIEQLLVQQLTGSSVGIVLISKGALRRMPDIGSYPLFTIGTLASTQLPPHVVLPSEFGAATALALSRNKLPETLVVIDADSAAPMPQLRTVLANCGDALVTSCYLLEATHVAPLDLWVVKTEALDQLSSGNREIADLVSAVHSKGGHRGYLHVH